MTPSVPKKGSEGGDPIAIANRASAIAAAVARCHRGQTGGAAQKNSAYRREGQKNALSITNIQGSRSKPIEEKVVAPTCNLEGARSGTAPLGRPKRRKPTTDQANSLVGFSA